MSRVHHALVAAFLVNLAFDASADDVEMQADYLCNRQAGELKIRSVVKASSRDPGEIGRVLGPRAMLLKKGKHRLVCSLPGATVISTIVVWPPQAQGECGGADHIRLELISAGERKLLENADFAHACWKSITELTVTVSGNSARVSKCTAIGWEWGTGFKEKHCDISDVETR